MNDKIAADILAKQTKLFARLQRGENLPPLPAGIKESDSLLQKLGDWLWAASDHDIDHAKKPLHGDCILATVLYDSGGHTAVIRDLADALPHPPLALWLTMAHPAALAMQESSVERTGMAEKTHFFPGHRGLECARQMVAALTHLRPSRLLLVHHPEDCVAVVVAAAAQAMGAKIVLLHHADRSPSAGIFLQDLAIVDLTSRCAAFTRNNLGLDSALLPLSCPDPGKRGVPFLSCGSLTTALCGSSKKVLAISSPLYPELVTTILRTTGGRHVHVGPLPPRMLRSIRKVLRQNSLPPESFVHIPKTSSLATILRCYAVDLMFNTYPRGGAKTAVDAMASGVPMLWHSPDPALDEVRLQMKYPEVPIWRNLAEVKLLLQSIDQDWLIRQGEAARRWYEQKHHPRLWAGFFSTEQLSAHSEPHNLRDPEQPGAEQLAEELLQRQRPIHRQWSAGNPLHAVEITVETLCWMLWPSIYSLLGGRPLRCRSLRVG